MLCCSWNSIHPHAAQLLAIAHFRRLPHEHATLYHNRFRTRLLFLSSGGNWRLCCSSRPFRLTNNVSRAVYQRWTVTCLATLTESDCTVVLQQKCDNATLIIFISTTTTRLLDRPDSGHSSWQTASLQGLATLSYNYEVTEAHFSRLDGRSIVYLVKSTTACCLPPHPTSMDVVGY